MRAFFYTLDFALKGLIRYKTRNLSIVGLFGIIVFLFSGIDFMSNALYEETLKALQYQPSLIVQNVKAGRQVPIELGWLGKIQGIPGVSEARGRVWGYYFDAYTGANYTVVGDPGEVVADWELVLSRSTDDPATSGPGAPKSGEALVGDGILKVRHAKVGGVLNFQDYSARPLPITIKGSFVSDVSLWTHDLIVLTEQDARNLFGVDQGTAWDLAVKVPNEFEVAKVGEKIAKMIPGARVISRNQLKRTYGSTYGFRSGILLSVSIVCLLAFLILAYDRVARLSQEEQHEIAILKVVGWQTRDVIRLNMFQSVILSLTGFMLGVVLSYYYVFLAGAPLLKMVFSGWSILYPPYPLTPAPDLSKVLGLMFLTVVPYVSVGIIPVWNVAVTDPEEIFRS